MKSAQPTRLKINRLTKFAIALMWYLLLIEYLVSRLPYKCVSRSSFQLHTAEVKSRVSHAKSDDRGGSGRENLQLDFLVQPKLCHNYVFMTHSYVEGALNGLNSYMYRYLYVKKC